MLEFSFQVLLAAGSSSSNFYFVFTGDGSGGCLL